MLAATLDLENDRDAGRYQTALDCPHTHPRHDRGAATMNIQIDLSTALWAKSSLSNGGDNCLEVAFVNGVVALRDSKDVGDPHAKILVISEDDYRAFTGGVQQGELLL
jgi:Domain of unknown function (DUF397)